VETKNNKFIKQWKEEMGLELLILMENKDREHMRMPFVSYLHCSKMSV